MSDDKDREVLCAKCRKAVAEFGTLCWCCHDMAEDVDKDRQAKQPTVCGLAMPDDLVFPWDTLALEEILGRQPHFAVRCWACSMAAALWDCKADDLEATRFNLRERTQVSAWGAARYERQRCRAYARAWRDAMRGKMPETAEGTSHE
jgi:hypothetical protein